MKRSLFALFLLAAASLQAADRADRGRERWVEQTLRSMTLDEKIGQMLVPAGPPSGGFRSIDGEDFQKVRRNIVDFHVGGYHVYGGDPAGNALMINAMQRLAKFPLLITADMEGGPGYVLFGATRLPLAMSLGATGNETLAYEAGRVTAEEARAIGINVDFYPVADVNNNPENPIINIRSFGEDPARVSAFVRAYIRGVQEHGVIATAKHFPGHGDVSSDSHLMMPVLDLARERLDAVELPPFRAAIAEGVGAVMSAHIYMPRLEPEKGIPSTLSKAVITGILRNDLHFNGVVFTDAMDMAGVTAGFAPGDAALRAVKAGIDIILFANVEPSFTAIKTAVASGEVPESRIDESVRRILRAKATVGLTSAANRTVDVNRLMEKVATREHRDLAQRISDEAITLVRDDRHVLPLAPSAETRVAQINILDTRTGWREGAVGRVLTTELQKRFPRAVTIQLDDQSTPNEYDMARKVTQLADVIVVNGFIRVAAYKGSVALDQKQMALLRDLVATKKPFVFTAFGSPFVLTHVPELTSYILTYDITPTAEMAAVKAITGEIEFKGKLPINLPGLYTIGHGLTTK